jgi:hypothetical protein
MSNLHQAWRDAIIAKDLDAMSKQSRTSLVNASLEELKAEREAAFEQAWLEELQPFPHIVEIVTTRWGSVFLDSYLNNLLLGTRDGKRQGFPNGAPKAIFTLIRENQIFLQRMGIETGARR